MTNGCNGWRMWCEVHRRGCPRYRDDIHHMLQPTVIDRLAAGGSHQGCWRHHCPYAKRWIGPNQTEVILPVGVDPRSTDWRSRWWLATHPLDEDV